jgi:hypothetical protein
LGDIERRFVEPLGDCLHKDRFEAGGTHQDLSSFKTALPSMV